MGDNKKGMDSLSDSSSKQTHRVRVIPATIQTGRTALNADGNRKRVCAYCRVSTEEE